HSEIFGGIFDVIVQAGQNGPSPEQRVLYDDFVRREKKIKHGILEKIMEYYNELRVEYLDDMGLDEHHDDDREDISVYIPKVKSTDDLHKIIKPVCVFVPDQTGKNKDRIGLLFDCSWDDRNGLGVMIKGKVLDDIGPKSICY
ncbi:MAG TPA: hypothetical protein VJC18_10995, partial [bacterium]|nr:hypothetical protein [bacterium]